VRCVVLAVAAALAACISDLNPPSSLVFSLHRHHSSLQVPPYYCMPDNRGSLSTPPWDQASYLSQKMHASGHRITMNECMFQ